MPLVIEIDLKETDLDEEQLLAALQEHVDKLEQLTSGDKLEFRATIDDGTFALESVERASPSSAACSNETFALLPSEPVADPPDQFALHYSFEWSAYRGCSDADDADITQSSARFIYRHGVVRFEFEEYVENDGE